MNSKLIFVLALAIFCLEFFLAVDALPTGREIREIREAIDEVLADRAPEDRGNPLSNLAYILCISKCFQVCGTYKVSTVVCYCQNVQCFDHCSTLEFAVKAREETDIVESREEIKRDVTAIGSHAVPVVWNPPPTFNGDLVSCIQDCNRACAKNSGYKCPTNTKKVSCSKFCWIPRAYRIGQEDSKILFPISIPPAPVPTTQSNPNSLVPRDVEYNPPMPWIQRLAHDDFPPDPAHVGVPGGPCEKLGPAGTAVPCRRDLDFREDVERDLATEEGNSLVRRTDTKVSLKQVASANATAVTSGTASMNATSASDSAAAAVVMSTVPSDVVPWNTAILRWNECQSICLNFCYTVNIPDTNTCQSRYGQCWTACFAKFEQSIGVNTNTKRSISRVDPLTPRVESTADVWGPVQNTALVTCRKECQAEKDECQYSEAWCADILKDCDASCNSKHPKAKARDVLDTPLTPRVESTADLVVGPVGIPNGHFNCREECISSDISCRQSEESCPTPCKSALPSATDVEGRDEIQQRDVDIDDCTVHGCG